MKVAIFLGFTALVAIQAVAVPSPEPEAVAGGIESILGKPVPKIHHKHHHHKHKHHHHKHHHHHNKAHLGKKKPNSEPKKANPLGQGFCGLPGMFCIGGKRDVGSLQGYEEGYCGAPGNPCNTVKRTAWALADALEEARDAAGLPTFDGVAGTPGELAQEAIDEITAKARGAYKAVYEREAEAFAEADANPKHAHPLGSGFCGLPGSPCLGGRDAKPDPEGEAWENDNLGVCGADDTPCLAVRDPTAEPKKKLGVGFCGLPGVFCMGGKRDAAPEPKKKLGVGFCGLPGVFCMGGKRDAAPQPKQHLGVGFCGLPGVFCMGGKRDAAPEPKKAHPLGSGFCGLPGSPCLGGRDAEAIAKIINQTDPTWLKNECHKEGHACHTIYKIHQAFHKAKGEGREFEKIKDPMAKFAHCGEKGADKCGYLTFAHQYAAKHNKPSADEAEQWCNAHDGLCTEAKRDLDELESTIDAAVAAIQAAA
jgi:hypothetical protein